MWKSGEGATTRAPVGAKKISHWENLVSSPELKIATSEHKYMSNNFTFFQTLNIVWYWKFMTNNFQFYQTLNI